METLRVENLRKSFGDKEVLKGVSFSIGEGEIVAILGPNASGKTTLIKCVLGLNIPDEGKIFVLGNDTNTPEYKRLIGYMPQEAHYPENLSPFELLSLVSFIRNEEPFYKKYLKLFQLEEFMDKPLKYLSGGTKQKVNATIALSFSSKLLILDEPTVGLDPISSAKLKRELLRKKEEGISILLTSHIIGEVEQLADRIEFLIEGEIKIRGRVEEIKDSTGESTLEGAILKLLGENL